MALVSEELGIKEADSTSTFLKQLMILLVQAMRDGRQKGYVDEHMKGARAIYRHIHFGGKVSYQVVSSEDAAFFEKILQNRRVPYVRLAETDGKTTIVTRDKDKRQVEKAWELLNNEKNAHDGSFAFVCSKCHPSFAFFGYFEYETKLKKFVKESL